MPQSVVRAPTSPLSDAPDPTITLHAGTGTHAAAEAHVAAQFWLLGILGGPSGTVRGRAMNRIHRNDIETMCAVCGRTMLLGERLVTFHRLEGGDARVCELCIDEAEVRGWVREGTPTVPLRGLEPLKPKGLKGLLAPRRRPTSQAPLGPDELPDDPRGAVEAGVELFNGSGHPRTVSGIARTLGDPRVSVVQRNASEIVVTVAWDLSWYQYRIDLLGPRPVTLPRRGA